jgi:rhodanese-related sulfurtransferase
MNPGLILNIILAVVLIGLIGQSVWSHFRIKGAAHVIEEPEFRENMRKAQVIDVRDKADFDAGHITGARNIPVVNLREYPNMLRKDQPVFLYDKKRSMSGRAALILKKQGYNDISILKSGYDSWTGKTKRKEIL